MGRSQAGIDDDIWDLEQDDISSERIIAAKSQAKLAREFANSGYKAGIDVSKAERMQEGFDQGLFQTIDHGQTVGNLLGALVAHRMVCKKLDASPQVPNLDSLIMRLRALKHTAAFDMSTTHIVSADSADITTKAFKELVKEAEAAVNQLL
ncbi:hypothetical protein LPJ78_004645 [Coemansia sp. RSA 989]|nr:hypothetical protein LPJ68_000432 [Coemansia sp. RSA 1086]KAJ1753520.1 hypothetical protein LPJ79_000380 [Coemansia sp. RSA 1821]KAJ1862571.1 hypothetical protein LPJ78_004645 [Coemansia sp. RSA 989]KAJ1870455.1 hypothetical protein LPJ55_004667 [Coemansia sp. RSA 990]KAJ2632010.1 hypothetical protein H4R22_001583 [Coemansia sp. RSA 1290]KAJ2651696.1 hypothetical protein IWW40_001597 [Coemansia sp. RSA 1250]KAJ2676670.1 hypothetical protein IWW42_000546 [Coemansia sp. RSA 1085]